MKTKEISQQKPYHTLSKAFVLFALAFGIYSSIITSQEAYDTQFDDFHDSYSDDDVMYLGEYNNPDTENTHLLFDAIRDDNLVLLTELINEKDADANAGSRRHEFNPLAYALTIDSCYEIIALLIEKGAYLDASNVALLSPYMQAIVDTFRREHAGVRSVIKSAEDCKKAEEEGYYVLHAAAYVGNLDLVRFLVETGFSVNQQNTRNQTPIFLAAYAGHKAVVEYLIEHGADLKIRDKYGLSALDAACFYGHQQVVRTLLARGTRADLLIFDPNEDRVNPLFIAACGGHTKLVEDFLLLGIDVNQRSAYGRRPLHAAAMGGHLETVVLLASKGAEIDCTDNAGNTPLHYASMHNHCKVISYLAEQRADSFRSNTQEKTPFDYIFDFRYNTRKALRSKLPEACVKTICQMLPLQYVRRDEDYGPSASSEITEDVREVEDTGNERATKRRRVAS